jgi:hypothetical protein
VNGPLIVDDVELMGFLYYPRQRQLPAALAALVETLRV